MEREGEILRKWHKIARCAKAAMVLLSLKQSLDLNFLDSKSTYNDIQEKELMKKMVEDLRTSLIMERLKRRKVKLFGVLSLALQVALLLSVWSFFLVTAFRFL